MESSGDAAGGAQAAPPPAALPRRAGSSAANGTLRTLGYLGAGYLGATDDEAAAPHLPADGRDRDQAYRYFRTAPGGEGYQPIVESGFQSPLTAPRSTFSVDVDTASYANVRRFLNAGQVPPADAVRLEELINYFRYDYPQPDGEHPFSVTTDVTACPWAASHRLVRIGLQGRTIPQAERAPSNLVFLVDVSGSMGSPDKLPLVAASLRLLVGRLDGRDRIALVTYAGAAGLVLDSTSCAEKEPILAALERLDAGGSTAGGAGIALAYQVASRHFLAGGTNRVILATDGDFNVGATSRQELQSLIERSAKSGVFLTVLGFGTGNLQDGTAELLADKGNGNYAYIDSLGEAQKVLVQQMGGTLVTIAKDVKLQVEFNPARVASYRLLGYENRALATRDFNDDRKDAGEIGAGHSVTALYEVVPVGAADAPALDALRYQTDAAAAAPAASAAPPALKDSPELLYVALRYKQPSSDSSVLLGQPLMDAVPAARSVQFAADGQFIAAVAEFGMLLRHGGNAGTASWDSVLALAEAGRGADKDGYRAEFVRLVGIAQSLLAPAGEPRR
ncbi:MAG TPA: von Willebrand factor type A domain-containing protein [Planctomycetota bacterium]|nr:von Willebrand factor type A domain-containing protein [Planctomycetota bacterium]